MTGMSRFRFISSVRTPELRKIKTGTRTRPLPNSPAHQKPYGYITLSIKDHFSAATFRIIPGMPPDLKNIPLSNLWNQKKERDKVLCWKEDSWSRQKEKRVLCYSEVPISSLCDITNTIDHVILGYKFTEYENLAKSIYSEDSKAYGMFYSRSFSCVKFAGDFMNDGLFVEFERFLKSNPEFKKKDEEINEKA